MLDSPTIPVQSDTLGILEECTEKRKALPSVWDLTMRTAWLRFLTERHALRDLNQCTSLYANPSTLSPPVLGVHYRGGWSTASPTQLGSLGGIFSSIEAFHRVM